MKRILKILLMPIFVIAPTMTVIACGEASLQVSDVDILRLAEGQMQDHTFKMQEKLGLNNLPLKTQRYNNLSLSTRGKIENYYQELVEPGITWDYPAVKVSITRSTANLPFLVRYGVNVEARIVVSAQLKYKNLESEKNIVIKITNDLTNEQQKITGITNYLKTYLNQVNPTFSFSTLLPDGLTSNVAGINVELGKIEAALKATLFTKPDTSDPNNLDVPIIDVVGVDLSVQLASTNAVIYNLNNPAISNNTVTGTLQNLILTLGYQTGERDSINLATDPNVTSLNVAQDIGAVNNQIANILNQGKGMRFFRNPLPSAGQFFADYDTDNSLTNAIQNSLFTIMSNIYTPNKMDQNNGWTATNITIGSTSSPYIAEDSTNGYFLISLSFKYQIASDTAIDVFVSNVQINLVQG